MNLIDRALTGIASLANGSNVVLQCDGYFLDKDNNYLPGEKNFTIIIEKRLNVGDIIEIVGKGAGGWLIAQNAGQTIHFGSSDTTTGAGGSLASTNRYNSIYLVCITANTDFLVKTSGGNITVV